MTRIVSALLLAGLLSFAGTSQAFTPESGWWWNPDEPGYGVSLEIQDTRVFLAIYTYNASGTNRQSKWYVAQGFLTDNAHFEAEFTANPAATNVFYTSRNGTCFGCPWTQFQPDPTDDPGSVEIEFLTETTAQMTWGNRTISIERHDFGLSTDPTITPKTELWLGEWQAVLDFSNYGGDDADFPFYGEVMVFDLLDSDSAGDFADGCRPENSLVGFCDQFALDNHSAFVDFFPGGGRNGQDVNVIIVEDDASNILAYEVEVGTYQFDGYAKLCPRSTISNVFTQCLDDDDTYPIIPVRGWRSASRAFVEGDDDAPNSRPAASAGKRGGVAALRARLGIKAETKGVAETEIREPQPHRVAADRKMSVTLEHRLQNRRSSSR